MSVLHIVNSPDALQRCLSVYGDGDVVMLIEDGVYSALAPISASVMVLDQDAAARGVADQVVAPLCSYADFVALTVEHHPLVSW